MNHITNTDAAWIAFAVLFPVILYLVFSGYQTKQRMSVRKSILDKFSRANHGPHPIGAIVAQTFGAARAS